MIPEFDAVPLCDRAVLEVEHRRRTWPGLTGRSLRGELGTDANRLFAYHTHKLAKELYRDCVCEATGSVGAAQSAALADRSLW